jgi:redox-sensitive bicupin YhaK (pirin superfamily)
MFEIRRAAERGRANFGWLDSHHTFSFGHYFDPKQMGWGPLRVINDDTVAPGKGFGTHPHDNMEIISYVLEGALEHKDTIGTGSVIRPGDVQMMEAGTGIAHSEFNHSPEAPVHFLQIWLMPDRNGIRPSYQQRHFEEIEKRGRLRVIVSPDARDGSLRIQQDAVIYSALLDGDERIEWTANPQRKAYLHVARGTLSVNGHEVGAGDGIKIAGEPRLVLEHGRQAEVLLFDLPDTH